MIVCCTAIRRPMKLSSGVSPNNFLIPSLSARASIANGRDLLLKGEVLGQTGGGSVFGLLSFRRRRRGRAAPGLIVVEVVPGVIFWSIRTYRIALKIKQLTGQGGSRVEL